MKRFRFLNICFFAAALSMVYLTSCDLLKEDEPEQPTNKYLISSEVAASITAQQSIGTYSALSPENTAFLSVLVTRDVEVRKVVYKTTFKNQKIQASGLVCLPKSAGDYPVLCFQNGTNTLHSMAPTEAVDDDVFKIIESIASMGFIVVIPDYIGFGASAQLPHPYLIAEPTTQSILDLLRAAKEYTDDELVLTKPTKDLYLFGYSQGGWATMCLQKKIETTFSDEFNLKASSCGAGPYSLTFITSSLLAQSEYPTPYFLAYLLNSYNKTGEINNPLTDFFNPTYADKIPGLFDGLHTGGAINSALTPNLSLLLTSDFRTKYESDNKFLGLRTALQANSVTAWKTNVPTRLYHGTDDEVIPLSMSQKMLADFKTNGLTDSQIKLVQIQGEGHTSSINKTAAETIFWFLEVSGKLTFNNK